MKIIDNLREIATGLELNDVLLEIDYIESRLKDPNKQLIIPVVGEFSSGKTTLLNSLLNNKKLETASKPTTSIIYEINFGAESEKVEMIDAEGNITFIDNVSELKNEFAQDISLVKIYDTSVKVPKSTILVDTPGLSSNDPKHIEALSNYLPNADALILCVDINQQITNTLLEFIKFNNLAHLPLYIIITKVDTKATSEIENVKKYINENIKLSTNNMISISATKENINEFYVLMDKIQNDKNEIVNNILEYRLLKIKDYLEVYIKNLIESSSNDKEIEINLKQHQRELDRLLNAINRLIKDTKTEMDEVQYETINGFKNIITSKLDSLISSNSPEIDQQAYGAINSTSNLMLHNYYEEVTKKLYVLANNRKNTELGIPLRSLTSIDANSISMTPLSYDIDLGDAGQQQVKLISNGIKIAAVIGAVALTAGMASGVAATAAGTTVAEGAAVSAASGGISGAATGAISGGAKAATAVAKSKSLMKAGMVLNAVKTHSQGFKENMQKVDEQNNHFGQYVSNNNQGLIENIVGKASDSVLGKPQRRKMINEYLESSLIPEFKSNLNSITLNLLSEVQTNLKEEAELTINQLESKLKELKELYIQENNVFKAKIKSYKNYLNLLK